MVFRILLLLCLLASTTAQAAAPRFWCSQRFLVAARHPFNSQHLAVARRGYIYAVAASLAMQKHDVEGRANHFALPARMHQVDHTRHAASGFEVSTFTLDGQPGGPPAELIVAFAGTNDATDLKEVDLGTDTRQFTEARHYLQQITARPEFRGLRVVVTGFSLGGALAIHVTKHRATRHLVAETWAFNPSPRTWVSGKIDPRIWMASTQNDGLRFARALTTQLIPGMHDIGAPPDQIANGFYLLQANPIVSHYRWVLTRNMLHAADLALQIAQHGDAPTEPLEILRASHFAACR